MKVIQPKDFVKLYMTYSKKNNNKFMGKSSTNVNKEKETKKLSKFQIYKKSIELIFEHKTIAFLLIIYGLLGSGSRFIFIQLLNKFNINQNFLFNQSMLIIALLLLFSVLSFWFTYMANLKGLDVLR